MGARRRRRHGQRPGIAQGLVGSTWDQGRPLLRTSLKAVLLVFAWVTPWFAWAQPERLEARLRPGNSSVRVQFSVTNSFTEAFRKRLAGGLTSRAVLQMELLDPNGDAIVVRQRRCELKLDVWDDRVYARVQDEKQVTLRRVFELIDDALKACGRVDIPLVSRNRLTARRGYRLMVRVALNPVSAELLERSRQFTSNPRGTASGRQSFFGAVARLFRSESDAEGTVFVFQSDELTRPAAEASSP